ncbi:glycosyltransferase 87 family protein [Corynebacterium accolens]|uniref:glycosyltransferase 87 family protein n=1 Tax=Corynebacterium accolens TaxID=38284 RepID=UPI002542FA5B|nr:glycosyltransferase 87 family protein [Corynebacterium accolens]MDK4266766.1 glycosyltransferase 87 family protein [Corynebacterium accolens]
MKKLYGLPTLATLLVAFFIFSISRYSKYDGPNAFIWRVPLDLKIYWLAGGEVAEGANLYDNAYIGNLPFTYPPFAGTLFKWISSLADDPLIILWQGGTILALLAVILMVFHERGLKLSPLTWVVAILLVLCAPAVEPMYGTLFYGQINVFLMFLVALDLIPKKWALPGVGIGLAAGLKLTPAFMGLVLLFQRRWWQAVISVLTFAVTVAIGFVTIPDAEVFWTDAIFNSSRVGEHTNPGAQSIRSLMVRAWGIDGGWMWLAAVAVVFILTCLALRTAMKHKNNSAAMALAGISACLVSPFSWYHHWVWVFPLAIVVLISVNQALGKRLRGVIGAQVAALVSFAAMCIVLLPYVSAAFWLEAANRSLNHWDFQPWAMLFFTGSGILYIAFYALWGFIPGTQPSEDDLHGDPHGGQHTAQHAAQPQHHAPLQQGQPQHAQPQHSQAQRTRAAGAPASGASAPGTAASGTAIQGSATADETAEFPVFNPETREFPSTEGYTDIPAPPSYGGRHARDNG